VSSTVTVEVQVDTFPLTSITVRVTVLSPTTEQSNAVSSIAIEAPPQLSNEPLSISAATMFVCPLASS